MKKDKLYTVNKWNQPMFADKNLFWPGGEMNSYGWTPSQMEPTSSLAYKPLTLPTLPGYENYGPQDLIGTQKPLKLTLSDSIIKDVNAQIQKGMQQPKPKKGLSNGTKMAMGVAGSAVGDFLSNIISNGYSAGEGFNSVMSGIRNVNTGNPLIDGIKNVATTAIQALGNRGWGVKENKENIAAIKQNTAQAKEAGNALASSTTSSDFFDNSGQMVGSLGFDWKDLYKNGMFTNKGTKEGNALIDKNNQALAMQRQGEVIGANNVDSYMDDGVMSNFKAAFGGPINTENNNSMGALEYGLMSDFLNTKQRQAENKNNMGNLFAGMPGSMFALGGDIEEPQDKTIVSKPLVLPIKREHNFSDSDYFWNAGFEYPAGLWKHKDGTFHTKGSYGKDIVLTQEEADRIIAENLTKERSRMVKKSILSNKKALGGDIQTNGADYSVGKVYDVSKEEANRLKAMGYEFTVIS